MEFDLYKDRKVAEAKYNFDFELEAPIDINSDDEHFTNAEVFRWEP